MADKIQGQQSDEVALTDREWSLKALTKRELQAYRFLEESQQPHLSPLMEQQLFKLWLNGLTCTDIIQQNPGLSLGQVVRARVHGDWDRRRQEYRDGLLQETQLAMTQSLMESFQFIRLQLAVAHRQFTPKLLQYLQTGDEADLPPFAISGWRSYQEAINALKSLSAPPPGEAAPVPVPEREVGPVAPALPQISPQELIRRQVELKRKQAEQQRQQATARKASAASGTVVDGQEKE